MKSPDKINILMVDDEPKNLIALESTLSILDQNLIEARSGKEALRQVLDHDFAVILLDVQMPGMNGFETAAAIRERERSRHIPIIFLTGHADASEMMFKGYSAGAVDFLLKPLQPDVLRAKVEVFVELALIGKRLQQEVTERTRAAAEVNRLNEQLEAKNKELLSSVEELQSYSYSISHDMRAPLRAMKGYSDILLEECSTLSGEHRGYLQKIVNGAERLDELIRDVLNYSILSRDQVHLGSIDLDQLAREIIEQYPGLQRPEADIEIEGKLPRVIGHEATLTQCISNLLTNAVKFVPPGVVPRIRISTRTEGRFEKFIFADNGIGIAPPDLQRIFGMFVKIHPATTYPGTGIGLAIARKAIEKLGGNMGVDSIVGEGSRFWIELRKAEPVA